MNDWSCSDFTAFCEEHGDAASDLLQEICELYYSNPCSNSVQSNRVYISEIERSDALNVILYGSASFGDDVYAFKIDDGNFAGTVVRSWVKDGDIQEPEERPGYIFAPVRYDEAAYNWFFGFRNTEDYRRLLREYGISSYLQDSISTQRILRDAEKLGLTMKENEFIHHVSLRRLLGPYELRDFVRTMRGDDSRIYEHVWPPVELKVPFVYEFRDPGLASVFALTFV